MYNNETSLEDHINSQANVKNDFLGKTYQLFGGSVLAGAAGAYLTLPFAHSIGIVGLLVLLVIEIGLIFAIHAKQNTSLGLPLLFLFGLISGATLAPLISFALATPNGASMVGQALLMTSIIFFGLSYYAMTTKNNLTGQMFGKVLMFGLIALIAGALINIFIGSSFVSLFIAWAGALLFSGFILYDTQAIIKGEYPTPVSAALSLYLNFLNLFSSILRIFLGSNDD